MSLKLKALALAVAAFVATGGVTLLISRGDTHRENPESVADQAPTEPNLRPARCGFAIGEHLAFGFSSTSTIVMDAAALLPSRDRNHSAQLAATRSKESRVLQGTLLWKVVGTNHRDGETHWSVLATMSEPGGSYEGTSLPPDLAAQLAEPVWLDIGERCTFERIGAASRRSPVADRQWRLLVGLIEMAMPLDASARLWTLEQDDSTGRVQAFYRRSDDDTRIERRKLTYLRANKPNDSIAVVAEIVNARAVATVSDPSSRRSALAVRWFDTLEVDEHTRILGGTGDLFADVNTRLSMRRKPADPNLAFWTNQADPSSVVWESTAATARGNLPPLRFAGHPVDQALYTMTAPQVVAAFSALLSADRRKEEALKMMVHYLRLENSHVDEVVGLIRRGGINAKDQPFVFLALQLAGGTKVRDALIAVASDGALPLVAQLQATSALKDVPEPDALVVGTLRALAGQSGAASQERAAGAQLAMGSLAARLKPGDPLRQSMQEDLAHSLTQAGSTEQLDQALAAAGNSRDERLATLVERHLDDPDAPVRTAALAAYAKMGHALPITDTLDRLATESDQPCARELGRALLARAPEATATDIDRAIAMLRTARPDALAVMPLIQFLGTAAPRSDAAMQALVADFYREKSPTLLALIGRYVPANRLP